MATIAMATTETRLDELETAYQKALDASKLAGEELEVINRTCSPGDPCGCWGKAVDKWLQTGKAVENAATDYQAALDDYKKSIEFSWLTF